MGTQNRLSKVAAALMHLRVLPVSLAIAVLTVVPAAAQGPERILTFDSIATVNPDATLTVIEDIRVVAGGNRIKRGIFRDFPTTYRDRQNNVVVVAFKVESVTRNGIPEKHFTRPQSGGVRLYIGDKDVNIPPGEHSYRITYRTNQQIGFFHDFDELFWNATGDSWAFRIEKATSTIILPPGANVLQHAAYTGPPGSTGKDFIVTTTKQGHIRFETTRTLAPGEGLTVAVAWPKGFVKDTGQARIKAVPPPPPQTVVPYEPPLWLRGGGLPTWFLGFVVLCAWYAYAWNRVGRDPDLLTPVPMFAPPDGFSPGAARYIYRSRYDDRTFSAALISLATKGTLKIREIEGGFSLEKISRGKGKSPGEQALLKPLFKYDKTIKVTGRYNPRIRIANDKLRDTLRNELEAYTLRHNRWWLVPAFLLTFASFVPLVAGGDRYDDAFASFILGPLALMLGYGFGRVGYTRWSDRRWFWGMVFWVLSAGALACAVYAMHYGIVIVSVPATLAVIATTVLFLVFYQLIKRPTELGTDVVRRLKGFRMYLETAERDRLAALHPPERTPELFEKFLPYAVALNVENAWAEGFTEDMERAGIKPADYLPTWYEGNVSNLGTLSTTLASGFASTVSQATVRPSTSSSGSSYSPGSFSGSSGGGFSGGGGGGGGGGGW